MQLTCVCYITFVLLLVAAHDATGDESSPAKPPGCSAENTFREIWIKVGERICLKCHIAGGEAADSNFRLLDSSHLPSVDRVAATAKNCDAFTQMAIAQEEDGRSRLELKAIGGLNHGGGTVTKADSTELSILLNFVRTVRQKPVLKTTTIEEPNTDDLSSFFDGVSMLSNQRLLRRITLSLTSRLPTKEEQIAINEQGLNALQPVLSSLMNEDAFYERLQEGFNDIFLTLGYNGNGEDVLSYNHFEHTRHWYQKHSLKHIPEQQRQRARYKLADQYREALRREPLELLRYIVANDHPFSEILTANYTMVSPYTARGYGIFEELRGDFRNPDDPFEYIPAKLKALKHRNGKVQPTVDGNYPHAGFLSMFQYLRRYPTTETNRNRLRARMYYQHFLGVDIMSIAPRVGDAAAIDAAYDIPTMQASECVVCHRTIDPVAGLFQDYYNEDGHYGPRKDGWFEDMFKPGVSGQDLPAADSGQALQWLGTHTTRDPRFAVAMVEHVYYILMGRRVLLPPNDIDAPAFTGRRRAYLAQRELIQNAAHQFSQNKFNLKVIFQQLIASKFYRADGLAYPLRQSERLVELDDLGIVRMLGPEQIERRITAIFGKPWGRLDDSYAILYGGIDSKEVTERLTDPSGAIGALQRILANDVACKNVASDFALPASERRLFPDIEPTVVPDGSNPEPETKIRAAIVHLHHHILGREDQPNDPEVDQTYGLFADVVIEAALLNSTEPAESYFCKSSGQEGPRDPDPLYTLRAWRAVVTYLLRQQEFLYE